MRAVVGERRKNSFVVARYGVLQKKRGIYVPPENVASIDRKKGERIENITRYYCSPEPMRLTQNCHFDID